MNSDSLLTASDNSLYGEEQRRWANATTCTPVSSYEWGNDRRDFKGPMHLHADNHFLVISFQEKFIFSPILGVKFLRKLFLSKIEWYVHTDSELGKFLTRTKLSDPRKWSYNMKTLLEKFQIRKFDWSFLGLAKVNWNGKLSNFFVCFQPFVW